MRFARERDLPVSVRGGGHAVAGHAVCDGGLMIDLSLMKAISVDPAARTARAAGGVLWGELDRATQRHGLATDRRHDQPHRDRRPDPRRWAGPPDAQARPDRRQPAAVDLVTADAERVHVDADTEPELFWGLRGGGGNFGIATAFEYRLHPVGPMVLGGPMLLAALRRAGGAAAPARDFAPTRPTSSASRSSTRLAPPMPFIPLEQYGKPVLS